MQTNKEVSILSTSTLLEEPIECNIAKNTYSSLCVPTQITKIGNDYFLVDCYHNQILTSTTLDVPLTEWWILTDQINRGHTIAGNGQVYLADDTENNRILIFEKENDTFYLTQTFENIGNRPHYIVYDEQTERFYALSSMNGEIYVFFQKADSNTVCLEKIMNLPGMQNTYIRSFTIDGNKVYFACCNGSILCVRKKDFKILEQWTVPNELAGLVQITKIADYYYLTVSTDITGNTDYATIVRTQDLASLSAYNYENLYPTFACNGTPYYISSFDKHYYLTQHCPTPGSGIWQFDSNNNQLENVQILFP